jgi:hypothetical protein
MAGSISNKIVTDGLVFYIDAFNEDSYNNKLTLIDYLVAYYSFENNTTDSHKYNLNGNVNPPGYTTGIIGQSANFPNDTTTIDGMKVPDNDRFSFTDGVNDVPFSISTWVKFDAFSSTGNWIINKRDNASNREWQLVYSTPNNHLLFSKFSEGGPTAIRQLRNSQSNLINTGEWYHIVVTDEGTGDVNDINIYLNGVNVNGTTDDNGYVKMNNGNQPLTIGQAGWTTQAATKHRGQIDEVSIYKCVVLTQQQILDLYNGGDGITYLETINISPKIANDLTLNQSIATLTNGVDFDGKNFISDGINDYITTNFNYNTITNITLSQWYKFVGNTSGILTYLGLPGFNGMGFYTYNGITGNVDGDKLSILYGGKSFNALNSLYTLSNGWYNLVLTYTTNTLSLYVNGILYGSRVYSPLTTSSYNLSLFGNNINSALGEGNLFKMYNRALSSSEVLQNYNALKSRYE